MKNQYMFFKPQSFEGLDLTQYQKTDIPIKQTQVCIYEFECAESDPNYDDETQAKMLDDLTLQLSEKYPDAFCVIYAESSQFYCRTLYPLIVEMETKLRQVLYISRTLYESEEIKADMFKYKVDKEEKKIEELDFGQIYTAIFTDTKLRSSLKQKYTTDLTKADLIKMIQELEESTEWSKMLGGSYSYIPNHFLEIKRYRNDVMHNHLINYETYQKAKDVFLEANQELEQVIICKLIVNDSEYLNSVNIVAAVSEQICASVAQMNEVHSSLVNAIREQTVQSAQSIERSIANLLEAQRLQLSSMASEVAQNL